MIKLFFCLPRRRNFFLQTPTLLSSYFSVLADTNLTNANAPPQNLFLHFITARFNISSPDTAKILKNKPALGRLKTLDNVEQVVSILSRYGCSEDQIANTIRFQPWILLTSTVRVLEPKIQVLKDYGVEIEVITKFPRVLGSKLKNLRSNLELLKTVFPTKDLLVRAISSRPYILSNNNLQSAFKPSVAFWEDFGFRGTELTKFLLSNPFVLTRSSLMPEQRDLIRKIGIHKENNMYKYIVSIVALTPIEVLQARIGNLQLCGLSPEEALKVARADPSVLQKSEDAVKKKMEFMLNHMNLSVDFVVKHPRMFTMSLDKVMKPRFLVYMRAMNGAGEFNPTQLHSMLMMTKAKFVGQIIEGHPESAALWTLYTNATADAKKFSVS